MNQKPNFVGKKLLIKLLGYARHTEHARLFIYGFIVSTFVLGATVVPKALATNTLPPGGMSSSLAQHFDFATVTVKNDQTKVAQLNQVHERQIKLAEAIEVAKKANPIAPSSQASRGGSTFQYNSRINMPEAYQQYLYTLCQERGLDYRKTLAVVLAESNFNPNKISDTHDYGYFQVNIINHRDLAKKLDTPNEPLNPIVNINWGTYMLSQLYQKYEARGLTGTALRDAVLSSYNRGVTGYDRDGNEYSYIERNDKALDEINKLFE